MFIYYNPNPLQKQVGDCVIRAITKLTGLDWYTVYDDLCSEGRCLGDLPSSNTVWSSYLRKHEYISVPILNTCPNCYTVKAFCGDNPLGKYLLAIGNHVVTVVNGDYYDSWDSGSEVPLYVWLKKGDSYANELWR